MTSQVLSTLQYLLIALISATDFKEEVRHNSGLITQGSGSAITAENHGNFILHVCYFLGRYFVLLTKSFLF